MSVDLYQPQRSWLEVMVPAAELAKQIAGTDFVPKSLRNNPAAIAAAILFGDEVGFGPMQSLAKISVIEGKPALAAEAQRALILRAGHSIWIEDATNTKVTLCGRRRDSEEVTRVTWTLDDAKRANLAGRPSWRMYPRQMLTARATAELARVVFADAIGGLAAIEELEDVDTFPPDVATAGNGAETATPRTRRRSKTALSPVVESGPSPASQARPPLPGEVIEEYSQKVIVEDSQDVGDNASPADVPDQGGAPTFSPASGEIPDASEAPGAPPASEERKLTLTQAKKAMDAIVGQLRKSGHLTTENLWKAMADVRSLDKDELIELLHGADPWGQLHWAPLRESLTLKEARDLHARLAGLWKEVMGSSEPVEETAQ